GPGHLCGGDWLDGVHPRREFHHARKHHELADLVFHEDVREGLAGAHRSGVRPRGAADVAAAYGAGGGSAAGTAAAAFRKEKKLAGVSAADPAGAGTGGTFHIAAVGGVTYSGGTEGDFLRKSW